MAFYAKVILDSIAPNGRRITTIEARYWRAIHAEIMTHRDRARNAASSRAIPWKRKKSAPLKEIPLGSVIKYDEGCDIVYSGWNSTWGDREAIYEYCVPNCTYSQMSDSPFIPMFIGSEQKGMQSGDELSGVDRDEAVKIIREMCQRSVADCDRLAELGVHKSIINRYLEPWSYITIIMTATRWENFFRLRIHPKAEKHFNFIAKMIKQAIDESTPTLLDVGQWHMPYITEDDVPKHLLAQWYQNKYNQAILNMCKVSAARCARVSYLTQDGKRDTEADLRLFNMLINPKTDDGQDDTTIHASPLEHVARADIYSNHQSGPFKGWHQLRKDYPLEDVDDPRILPGV